MSVNDYAPKGHPDRVAADQRRQLAEIMPKDVPPVPRISDRLESELGRTIREAREVRSSEAAPAASPGFDNDLIAKLIIEQRYRASMKMARGLKATPGAPSEMTIEAIAAWFSKWAETLLHLEEEDEEADERRTLAR